MPSNKRPEITEESILHKRPFMEWEGDEFFVVVKRTASYITVQRLHVKAEGDLVVPDPTDTYSTTQRLFWKKAPATWDGKGLRVCRQFDGYKSSVEEGSLVTQ